MDKYSTYSQLDNSMIQLINVCVCVYLPRYILYYIIERLINVIRY